MEPEVATFVGQVKTCGGDRHMAQWKTGTVRVFRREDGTLNARMFLKVSPSRPASVVTVMPDDMSVKSNRVIVKDKTGTGFFVRLNGSREAEESRDVIRRLSSYECSKRSKAEVGSFSPVSLKVNGYNSENRVKMNGYHSENRVNGNESSAKILSPPAITTPQKMNKYRGTSMSPQVQASSPLDSHPYPQKRRSDEMDKYNENNKESSNRSVEKRHSFTGVKDIGFKSPRLSLGSDSDPFRSLNSSSFYGKNSPKTYSMKDPLRPSVKSVGKTYRSGLSTSHSEEDKMLTAAFSPQRHENLSAPFPTPPGENEEPESQSMDHDYNGTARENESSQNKSSNSVAGFDNLGNTCFINSPLQCLSSLEPLSLDIQDIVQQFGSSLKKESVLRLLYLLMKNVRTHNLNGVKIKTILKVLREYLFGKFAVNTQQDSHELLSEILDQIHEEIQDLKRKEEKREEEEMDEALQEERSPTFASPCTKKKKVNLSRFILSPTEKNFSWFFKNSFDFHECKKQVWSHEEHDTTLMLAFTSKSHLHLQDCLDDYFKSCEVEVKCESCDKNETATINRKIIRRPRYLILNLLRYQAESCESKKNLDSISIPRFISIADYCSEDVKDPLYINPVFMSERTFIEQGEEEMLCALNKVQEEEAYKEKMKNSPNRTEDEAKKCVSKVTSELPAIDEEASTKTESKDNRESPIGKNTDHNFSKEDKNSADDCVSFPKLEAESEPLKSPEGKTDHASAKKKVLSWETDFVSHHPVYEDGSSVSPANEDRKSAEDDIDNMILCGKRLCEYTEEELANMDPTVLHESEVMLYAQALSRFEYMKEINACGVANIVASSLLGDSNMECEPNLHGQIDYLACDNGGGIDAVTKADLTASTISCDSSSSRTRVKSDYANKSSGMDLNSDNFPYSEVDSMFREFEPSEVGLPTVSSKVPDIFEASLEDSMRVEGFFPDDGEEKRPKNRGIWSVSSPSNDPSSDSQLKRTNEKPSQSKLETCIFCSGPVSDGQCVKCDSSLGYMDMSDSFNIEDGSIYKAMADGDGEPTSSNHPSKSSVLSDKGNNSYLEESSSRSIAESVTSPYFQPDSDIWSCGRNNGLLSPRKKSVNDIIVDVKFSSPSSSAFQKPKQQQQDPFLASPAKTKNLTKTRDYGRLRSPVMSPRKKLSSSKGQSPLKKMPNGIAPSSANKKLIFPEASSDGNLFLSPDGQMVPNNVAETALMPSSGYRSALPYTTDEEETESANSALDRTCESSSGCSNSSNSNNSCSTNTEGISGKGDESNSDCQDVRNFAGGCQITQEKHHATTAKLQAINTSTPIVGAAGDISTKNFHQPLHITVPPSSSSSLHPPNDFTTPPVSANKLSTVIQPIGSHPSSQQPKPQNSSNPMEGLPPSQSHRNKINRSLSSTFAAAEEKENSSTSNEEEQVHRKRLSQIECGESDCSYRLVGIVNHIGESLFRGHYTSYSFNLNKQKWFYLDDKHTRETTEATVRRESACNGYVFFYMDKNLFDSYSNLQEADNGLRHSPS